MLLRAIIIDDEQNGINALSRLITLFITDVKIVAQANNAITGVELIENYKPEIVFLDINMPEIDGFGLLEKLSWKDFNLIFTTAHQEYALRALKNNAIDYLLKPIDREDLNAAITKVRARLQSKEDQGKHNYAALLETVKRTQPQSILINSKTVIESIEVSDIVYLKSRSNYTAIYLEDTRKIVTTKTLKELEAQLCTNNPGFMRVHQSFIVNLEKVVRYIKLSESIVMSDGHMIPLGKSRREEFYRWMGV